MLPKKTPFLFLKVGSIGFLLMIASINSYAHDNERIKKLEQDIQELKTRLNNLEVNKTSSDNAQKPIKSSDGWQSLANWRQLQTGMNPSQIRELLGEPQRINGGDVATWTYLDSKRMGWVMFVGMRVHSWEEPR